jgi:hypothetical protein
MEYKAAQPPVNGSHEDTLRWSQEEFGRLEQVIAELLSRVETLEQKG